MLCICGFTDYSNQFSCSSGTSPSQFVSADIGHACYPPLSTDPRVPFPGPIWQHFSGQDQACDAKVERVSLVLGKGRWDLWEM